MLRTFFARKTHSTSRTRTNPRPRRIRPGFEPLEARTLPTVSCLFNFLTGLLTITDTGGDNSAIRLAVDAEGHIDVFDGAVKVDIDLVGGLGLFDLLDVDHIQINADAGADHVVLDFGLGLIDAHTSIAIDCGGGSNLLTINGQINVGDVCDIGTGGINLDGDADIDITIGNVARIIVRGQSGNDKLNASGSIVAGGAVNLQVELFGGSGSDTIVGTPGDDTLQGGGGNDTVQGGGGDDAIDGGLGDDQIDGGEGHDTLLGNGGNDTLSGSGGDDDLGGGTGNDSLVGGDGKDSLDGGTGNDTLAGGLGDDWYRFAGTDLGSDFIFEVGPCIGSDTLDFSGQPDAVVIDLSNTAAQAVNVHLTLTLTERGVENTLGSDFDDVMIGNACSNRLDGSLGADTLTGLAGNDSLFGGFGLDRVTESGDVDFILTNTSLTGMGSDSLDSIEQGFLTGGVSNNFIDAIAFVAGTVNLDGAGGNDFVRGGPGADTLSGGEGNDTLTGRQSDDLLFGGNGNDRLRGNRGIDVMHGGEGNDFLGGGRIEGDSMFGEGGNDSLRGGQGDDTLVGGSGSDLYLWSLDHPDRDTVIEADGGVDFDVLSFAGFTVGVSVDLGRTTPQMATSMLSITLSGSTAIEGVIGSQHNDTLIGNSLANRLEGLGGNDLLRGAAGDDFLDGGDGFDRLFGEAGADVLINGEENHQD